MACEQASGGELPLPTGRHLQGRELPLLANQRLRAGERWLYSAGFNVADPISDSARIDCELDDLARLARAGARIAILAHQGSHRQGTARPLGFVAGYLQTHLGRTVRYVDSAVGPAAEEIVRDLRDGELVLLGNTRLLAGEEAGDTGLARLYARLGERIAVGGFSKAHRAHASNVAILEHLPGVAACSLTRELDLLAPWAQKRPGCYSVAALGGLKREKLTPGLTSLARRYDLLIPGGAVLNALLVARGHDVGGSELGECGDQVRAVQELLGSRRRAELHLPSRVTIAPLADCRPRAAREIDLAAGVPHDHAIVDFRLEPWARARLERLSEGGRALLAGPPTLYRAGFRHATDAVLDAMSAPPVEALVLGGDSVAELPWDGPASTGGGAALCYLATGTCVVLRALARQQAVVGQRTPVGQQAAVGEQAPVGQPAVADEAPIGQQGPVGQQAAVGQRGTR